MDNYSTMDASTDTADLKPLKFALQHFLIQCDIPEAIAYLITPEVILDSCRGQQNEDFIPAAIRVDTAEAEALTIELRAYLSKYGIYDLLVSRITASEILESVQGIWAEQQAGDVSEPEENDETVEPEFAAEDVSSPEAAHDDETDSLFGEDEAPPSKETLVGNEMQDSAEEEEEAVPEAPQTNTNAPTSIKKPLRDDDVNRTQETNSEARKNPTTPPKADSLFGEDTDDHPTGRHPPHKTSTIEEAPTTHLAGHQTTTTPPSAPTKKRKRSESPSTDPDDTEDEPLIHKSQWKKARTSRTSSPSTPSILLPWLDTLTEHPQSYRTHPRNDAHDAYFAFVVPRYPYLVTRFAAICVTLARAGRARHARDVAQAGLDFLGPDFFLPVLKLQARDTAVGDCLDAAKMAFQDLVEELAHLDGGLMGEVRAKQIGTEMKVDEDVVQRVREKVVRDGLGGWS
jgi:hypothetical protein